MTKRCNVYNVSFCHIYLNHIYKYSATDGGSMEAKRVWQAELNKEPIIVVKVVG
jgi:hypothetical protein